MSARWHDGRLIALDLETTSPDPNEARIVTAAIACCGGGEATDTLSLLADPGVEIPAEATEVHGISTEHAREHGHPAGDVVGVVLDTLRMRLSGGLPLIIFNARYDLTVLDREARRHGMAPLEGLLVVDPLVIDKWLDRYRKGSRKLDAICAHYNAVLDGAHDADNDALAAARVAWRIGKAGRVIRRVRNGAEALEMQQLTGEWERVRHDLPALHAAQQRWARAERDRFAEYKRGQGEGELADQIASEDWPMTPLAVAA